MKRVIVVDDDRRTRRVMQIMIESIGLESQAFDSAESALEFLAGESVELVLTDLRMPGMDGIEFMTRLRRLDEHVPVIVMTAYGTVEVAVEAMKLGALDFVAKPFDVDALELLIRRSLESSRRRQGAGRSCHPRLEPAEGRALRTPELLRHPWRAARE